MKFQHFMMVIFCIYATVSNAHTIQTVNAIDIRFPTSVTQDGSDAMHTDPDYSMVYVTINTNTGLQGQGFTFTLGRGNEVVKKAVEALIPFVEGKTLTSIEKDFAGLWRTLTSEPQLRWIGPEKGAIQLANAAIVNAIWDLLAKSHKKPLWKYLADMEPEQLVSVIDFRYIEDVLTRQEAINILNKNKSTKLEREKRLIAKGYPAYVTSAGWMGYSEPVLREKLRHAVREGWVDFKMKVGLDLAQNTHRAKIIREEIGNNRNLMMDANQCWGVGEAVRQMQALKEFNPVWIEEPTSPDDVVGHSVIAKAVHPIKVATGEHGQNRVLFKQLFQLDGIDVVQIDAVRHGGINEALAIMLMAAKYNKPVCPHAGGVGLCELVQHLAMFDYIGISASLDDRILEYVDHLHEHFTTPVKVAGNAYMPPLTPGFSSELKLSAINTYQYPQGDYWKKKRS